MDDTQHFIDLFDNLKIIQNDEYYSKYPYYYLEDQYLDETINIDIPLTELFICMPECIEHRMYENCLNYMFNNFDLNDFPINNNYQKCYEYFSRIAHYLKEIKLNNFKETKEIKKKLDVKLLKDVFELLREFYYSTEWDTSDECYNDLDIYTKALIDKLKYYIDILIINRDSDEYKIISKNRIQFIMNLNNIFQLIFYILFKIESNPSCEYLFNESDENDENE